MSFGFESVQEDGQRARLWVAATAVMLAGAALRLVGLGGWDMWTDEVQTLWMAESGDFWFGPMYRTAPVNFWLTSLSVDMLGADEVGLRAVPAVTGILTLVCLYPIARQWVSERAALLATAVLAFSFWHVAWSQTGRHFALQTLLVLGALHGFLAYWQRGNRTWLGLSAVLLLGAMFTHSSSGFYVAALLSVVLVAVIRELVSASRLREGLRSVNRRTVVAGLVLTSVILLYLPIYLSVGTYVLENRSAWNPPWNIVGSLGFYITAVLAGFAAGGGFYLWGQDRELALTLVSVVLVPILLLVAASGLTIASAAYVLPSMVAVALLVGTACDGLLRTASEHRTASLCAALVVAGLFMSQGEDLVEYYLFQNGLKPRWTEATEYVAERKEPGQEVWASEGDVAQYYMGPEGVHWMGDHSEEEGEGDGETPGAWFILYLQSSPDFGAMTAPTLRAAELPADARVEAVFPLNYGPKNRTLVVAHRAPEGTENGGEP